MNGKKACFRYNFKEIFLGLLGLGLEKDVNRNVVDECGRFFFVV